MVVRLCGGWLVAMILIVSCTGAGTESQITPAIPFSPSPLADNPNIPLSATPVLLPITSPSPVTLPALAPSATPTSSPFMTPTSDPTATPACSDPKGALRDQSFDSATFHRNVAYSLYLPPCYDLDASHVYPVLYLLHGVRADQTQWPDLNVAPDADQLIAEKRVAPFVVVMPGGDWALQLALTHPDLFAAVGAHSAVAGEAPKFLGTPGQHTLRIYLDVGSADPLRPGMEALAATLQAQDFAPTFHVYPGGHDRPYW